PGRSSGVVLPVSTSTRANPFDRFATTTTGPASDASAAASPMLRTGSPSDARSTIIIGCCVPTPALQLTWAPPLNTLKSGSAPARSARPSGRAAREQCRNERLPLRRKHRLALWRRDHPAKRLERRRRRGAARERVEAATRERARRVPEDDVVRRAGPDHE